MKPYLLVTALALSLLACKEKKQDHAAAPPAATTTGTAAEDSAAIRQTVTGFYDWYTTHYNRMMGYKLYSGLKKPDMPPYKINWEEVDRYQAFIRDSVPYLGAAFLVNQRKMFQQCDSAFKVDTQDEIPYGFDYDWYTNSQEDPAYLLKGIKASGKWMLNIEGETAKLEIGAPDEKEYLAGSLLLFVELKKENGQWKISQIGND